MTTWQSTPGTAFYPGQGFPQQNPGYPPREGYNSGYRPPYGENLPPYGENPPGPGFIPPAGATPFVQPPFGTGSSAGPNSAMYGSNFGEESKAFNFDDKSIRNGFIRKVYSILICQLLITISMITVFLYHRPTQLWVMRHPEIFWICFAVTIVMIICMACCDSVRRKAPMNFIFLFIFTLAESFLLATAASRYNAQEVLLAVGITAAVCLGLTVFAFQTKFDFTGFHSYLFVAMLVFLLFGIIAMIWQGKIMTLVYASIGALLFSFYLVYDTQMMINKNHKYTISPEEYIFAALNIYIDVVNIFIYILTIIGHDND